MSAYHEYRSPGHAQDVLACMWELESATDHVKLVIPDGCLDVIWLAERELVIAGADTGPRSVALPAQTRTSGVRLRPGAAGAALGLPASEVRDQLVGLDADRAWADLAPLEWLDTFTDELAGAHSHDALGGLARARGEVCRSPSLAYATLAWMTSVAAVRQVAVISPDFIVPGWLGTELTNEDRDQRYRDLAFLRQPDPRPRGQDTPAGETRLTVVRSATHLLEHDLGSGRAVP
jgi:hypothetical protein